MAPHVRSLALLMSAAALGAPVFALTPDEEALVRDVEGLYRPEAAQTAGPMAPGTTGVEAPAAHGHNCGSARLHSAYARWDSLSAEARDRMAAFLRPPDEGDATGVGPAAPTSTPRNGSLGGAWITVETDHFRVKYQTTGENAPPGGDANGNGTPDFADHVLRYLEQVYAKEVQEMGYTAPADAKLLIYLRKLNYNGLTHPLGNRRTWIELNTDILGYTKRALGASYDPKAVSRDPEGVEAGLLKAVCAHEFFHSVQAMYNWNQPAWWSEGTADWMGNQVFPESGFYLNNVGPHLERPETSLFTEGDFNEYSASLFPTFLTENLGGPETIRQVWELCRTIPVEQALNQVLGDLPSMFEQFACYNLLRQYKDGRRMPEADRRRVQAYPAQFAPLARKEPQYYGSNFVEFIAPASGGTLSLSFQPQAGKDVRLRVIVIDKEQNWKIIQSKSKPGAQTLDVPSFGGTNDKVWCVMSNFTRSTLGGYSLSATVK